MQSEVERVTEEARELEPPAPQAGETETLETATVEPAEDADEPEAVELKPGERYVPVSAVKALREQIKELKPKAKKADELDAYLAEKKPYVGFVEANWQALTNPQPQAAPQAQAPAQPAVNDKQAEDYARKFDLYTADGKLDLARAQAIIEDNRRMAREEIQQAIEPMQTQTYTQQAEANYSALLQAKDHAGRPLEKAVVDHVIGMITSQLPRAKAAQVLADKNVTDLLLRVARDTQMQQKGPGVKAPDTPPLVTERAGGGTAIVLSENERRIARSSGMTEAQYAEKAKKADPRKYIDLE